MVGTVGLVQAYVQATCWRGRQRFRAARAAAGAQLTEDSLREFGVGRRTDADVHLPVGAWLATSIERVKVEEHHAQLGRLRGRLGLLQLVVKGAMQPATRGQRAGAGRRVERDATQLARDRRHRRGRVCRPVDVDDQARHRATDRGRVRQQRGQSARERANPAIEREMAGRHRLPGGIVGVGFHEMRQSGGCVRHGHDHARAPARAAVARVGGLRTLRFAMGSHALQDALRAALPEGACAAHRAGKTAPNQRAKGRSEIVTGTFSDN